MVVVLFIGFANQMLRQLFELGTGRSPLKQIFQDADEKKTNHAHWKHRLRFFHDSLADSQRQCYTWCRLSDESERYDIKG